MIVYWFFCKSRPKTDEKRNEAEIRGKFGDLDSDLNLSVKVSEMSFRTEATDGTPNKNQTIQVDNHQNKPNKVKNRHPVGHHRNRIKHHRQH